MKIYTYTEARQKLATVLDQVAREGEVRIRRRSGEVFIIKLLKRVDSPLSVKSLDLNIDRAEILESIQEGRKKL